MEQRSGLFNLFHDFAVQRESNLLIVPMQTGSGKTFTAVQFMADFIADRRKPECERQYPFRRIVYATGLRSNLPWKDLAKVLSKEDYDSHVLVVRSNSDSVEDGINALEPSEMKQIDKRGISGWRDLQAAHRKLSDARSYCEDIRRSRSGEDRHDALPFAKDTLRSAQDDFVSKEAVFRRDLRRSFFNDVSTYLHVLGNRPEYASMASDERSDAVRRMRLEDPMWSWIPKLYPVCNTYDRDVVFMTVTKMIKVYDTVVGPKNLLYNSDFADNTLFIIDEFDSAKTMMVSNLLDGDDMERRRIDTTEMFRAIQGALHDRGNHPPVLYEVYGKPEDDSLRVFASRVADEADLLASEGECNLRKRFFLEKGDGERYIFHDYRAITVSGGLPIYTFKDGRNHIDLGFHGEITEGTKTLESLFTRIERFFGFFASLVRRMAMNHRNREEGEGRICPLDMAVRSVLDAFELPAYYDVRIETMVQRQNQRQSNRRFENDGSFYNTGFRYYEIESSREHSETSKMYQTAYDTTPEKILMQMLAHDGASLIGISATATIYSVISNFDVNYLFAEDSPCRLRELSVEDVSGLKDMYSAATSHYDRVDVEVVTIDQAHTVLAELLGDVQAAYEVNDVITSAVNMYEGRYMTTNSSYVESRYLRFAIAYRHFLDKASSDAEVPIYSELALFNISAKDDPSFDTGVLTDICRAVLGSVGKAEPDLVEVPMMVLRGGEDFDEDFVRISRRLAEGKKVFILSTYPTVGFGQNLQYAVPDGIDTVCINDFPQTGMKDIDAIYLDGLTNIMPTVRKGDYFERDKYVYCIEELVERGELTAREANSQISYAFDHCAGNKTNHRSLRDLDSFALSYIRSIIQGVGRITRTNTRNPVVFIFADVALAQYFRLPLEKYGVLRSREFEELYRVMNAIECVARQRASSVESKDTASAKGARRIDSMLAGIRDGRSEAIEQYDALGDLVLRHPVCNSYLDGAIPPSIKLSTFYTRLSEPSDRMRYRIGQNDARRSYSDVVCEVSDGVLEVSMHDCNLARMMRYRVIRDGFKAKGYATAFDTGRYILAPSVYNRIYKGRIGEEAGRCILDSLGIPHYRLSDEHYEMFDDMLAPGVFADYKNWNSRQSYEADQAELDHAFDKLAQLGGRVLVIMNIVKPGWDMPPVHSVTRDGMKVLQIAYMVDDTNTICSEAVAELRKVLE